MFDQHAQDERRLLSRTAFALSIPLLFVILRVVFLRQRALRRVSSLIRCSGLCL